MALLHLELAMKKLSKNVIYSRTTCGWLWTDWIPGRLSCLQTPGHGWGPCIYKQLISSLARVKGRISRRNGMQNSHVCLTGEGFKWLWWYPFKLEQSRLWCNTTHNFVYVKPRTEKKSRRHGHERGGKKRNNKNVAVGHLSTALSDGINWLTIVFLILDEKKSC
jgi:hypothetical protein